MINVTHETLPEGTASKLRSLLAGGDFATLLRVIEAKEKSAQAEAINNAVEGGTYEGKMNAADDDLKKARRFAIAREVLRELADQKETFTIVKLT